MRVPFLQAAFAIEIPIVCVLLKESENGSSSLRDIRTGLGTTISVSLSCDVIDDDSSLIDGDEDDLCCSPDREPSLKASRIKITMLLWLLSCPCAAGLSVFGQGRGFFLLYPGYRYQGLGSITKMVENFRPAGPKRQRNPD